MNSFKKYIYCLALVLFFFSLSAKSAVAAPAFVQANANSAGGSSSNSVSFLNNVVSGNVIAFGVSFGYAVSLSNISATCVSGNFTLLDNPTVYGSSTKSAQGYAIVSNSGSCTITANFSGSNNNQLIVQEITGVDIANPLDGHAMLHQDAPGSSTDSGTITTTKNGDYIFGIGIDSGSNGITWTQGTGFTNRFSFNGGTFSATAQTEDKIQNTAGPVSATFTISPTWSHPTVGIIAFAAASISPPDTTAPSTPTNLTATATSQSQINLSWTASTDDTAVTGYKIYRGGVQVGTSINNNYNDNNLTANTAYSYTVSANDAANNNSAQSASASATTQSLPAQDITPPSVPTNLSATAVSSTQINLSWTASTDNAAVTGYKIYRGGVQIGTTITNNYNDNNLTANTTYSYTVSAYDAANNNSTQSGSSNATTQAGQTSGTIIPADRKIDWSLSGISGGVPSRTTVCANISAGATQATIQSALNSCPSGQVVKLASGTYNITSSLTIPSNVTLRGSGPGQTILNAQGTGSGVIIFGTDVTPLISNSTAISSGSTAGSQTINVASASGIVPGSYLMITELNDPSYVTITTSNGSCTWCDGGIGWNGTRVLGQIVEVTSVSGNAVSFTPPLYTNYSLTPLATRFSMGAKYAGVEDLQVYMNNTGYRANFRMSGTAYSWIKNVESNYTDGDHVQMLWGYRNEIRDSYFHDAFRHTPGSTDADVFIADKSSGNLIENNTLRRLHAAIMLNWGAAGNIVSYNYIDNNFDTNGYNTMFGGLSVHGAHPQFNLWEGNMVPGLSADYFWGSSSHSTAFRNWFKGVELVIPPLTGRAAEDLASAFWAPYALAGVDLGNTVRYYNFLGNVIGSDKQKTFSTWTPKIFPPQARSYYSANNPYGYSFGYAGPGDSGADPGNNSLPYTTALIHGDYDYVRNSFTWDSSNPNHNLPASLYLSVKPTWFGNSAWPAFGPDVNNSSLALTSTIPAKSCFDQGLMPNCLSSSSSQPPTYTPGDFNHDGAVNSLDYSLLNANWFKTTNISLYDLQTDGIINSFDYAIFKSNWGK